MAPLVSLVPDLLLGPNQVDDEEVNTASRGTVHQVDPSVCYIPDPHERSGICGVAASGSSSIWRQARPRSSEMRQ